MATTFQAAAVAPGDVVEYSLSQADLVEIDRQGIIGIYAAGQQFPMEVVKIDRTGTYGRVDVGGGEEIMVSDAHVGQGPGTFRTVQLSPKSAKALADAEAKARAILDEARVEADKVMADARASIRAEAASIVAEDRAEAARTDAKARVAGKPTFDTAPAASQRAASEPPPPPKPSSRGPGVDTR